MSRALSRTVKCNDACSGCTYEVQQVPRTIQFREIWTQLSPACDAEQKAMRAAALEAHREQTAIHSLTEDLSC